jgi:hypothetical protein
MPRGLLRRVLLRGGTPGLQMLPCLTGPQPVLWPEAVGACGQLAA